MKSSIEKYRKHSTYSGQHPRFSSQRTRPLTLGSCRCRSRSGPCWTRNCSSPHRCGMPEKASTLYGTERAVRIDLQYAKEHMPDSTFNSNIFKAVLTCMSLCGFCPRRVIRRRVKPFLLRKYWMYITTALCERSATYIESKRTKARRMHSVVRKRKCQWASFGFMRST